MQKMKLELEHREVNDPDLLFFTIATQPAPGILVHLANIESAITDAMPSFVLLAIRIGELTGPGPLFSGLFVRWRWRPGMFTHNYYGPSNL